MNKFEDVIFILIFITILIVSITMVVVAPLIIKPFGFILCLISILCIYHILNPNA